jgi:uncharacterized damage-inducible protein DinB
MTTMPTNEETGRERELLEGHLEGNRSEVRRKVTGLDWNQATRRLGVSATSAAGIVKHLTDVERWWFRHQLDGEDGVLFAWTDDEPDREFEFTSADTLDGVLDEYDRACDESRAHAALHGLDHQIARPVRWMNGQRPSLRWVYLHMIEETARHNGHLDIYRELLDGTVDQD